MASSTRFFGTDGIRGRVGQPPMDPNTVLKLGWAIGKTLGAEHSAKVLVGKDTRISGYMFESALEAGLSSAGADIGLLGPFPTPGIAYLTQALKACASIVISASHNPYHDNGIKIFSNRATKLSDSQEREIEHCLKQPLKDIDISSLGKAFRVSEAEDLYVDFCKRALTSKVSLEGIKIVVDCAHGASYHIAPRIYAELGAELEVIGAKPNGFNINDGVGTIHPQLLQHQVVENEADLGIAFDGDGDRLLMVDASGNLVDGDQLLFVLARHIHQKNHLDGGVVGTEMSNLGLELALAECHIPFARAKVGDRYVLQMLKQKQWFLGGETSGHIVCLDKMTTGDAIIASLLVLQALILDDRTLADATAPMEKYPQALINISIDKPHNGDTPKMAPQIERVINQACKALNKEGRVLIRPSGTEPVLRIMVESHTEDTSRLWADRIADAARRHLPSTP